MTEIWGHRGASGTYPENTLPAFQAAADMGAQGIELDIQLTKDNEIVVCHDETVDRTSSGTGYIKDMTLEELRELDFSVLHPEHGPAQIPTMREVFELIRPTGLLINIELKTGVFDYPGIEEKITALTAEFDMNERVIYSSFNHYSMLRIKELCPKAHTAFLYADGPVNMPAYAAEHLMDAIHPWVCNLRYPRLKQECDDLGLKINSWTVNTEEEARICLDMGIDAMITNYPDRMLEFRRQYESESFRYFIEHEVRPWLDKCVQDGWMVSDDELNLHFCQAVHPQEKAAVVMVHGFCEFFGKYHETAYRFYQNGYSVFFLEQRGHGLSDRTHHSEDQRVHVDDFSEYVNDLHSFIQQIVLPRSHTKRLFLFAHSMGGATGALYMEQYPGFRCAVLSSPMLRMDVHNLPDWTLHAVKVYSRIRDKDTEYAPGQGPFTGENIFEHSSCVDEDRYEYQLEQRRQNVHYQTWGSTWGWASAAHNATERAQKDADKVNIPVLICQAGHDNMVKNEGQDIFRARCPYATIVRYPASKHEIFNADSDTRRKYYQDILDFYQAFVRRQEP
ncbi:MAG: alpha/beta fold hydrolase [Solobacterium sp.]|nr:alpha/beta fold hydrolase [Solobacterium sp.]